MCFAIVLFTELSTKLSTPIHMVYNAIIIRGRTQLGSDMTDLFHSCDRGNLDVRSQLCTHVSAHYDSELHVRMDTTLNHDLLVPLFMAFGVSALIVHTRCWS